MPVVVAVPAFSCVTGPFAVQLPAVLSGLRALGKLKEEKVVRVQSWEGYKAVERWLRFEGMELQIVTFTNDPERYTLGSALFESPRWSQAPARVGEPSGPLVTRLGAAQVEANANWRFAGETDSLYIQSKAGKISRVLYECYTG
ncbi:MAG: hypothetical protein V4669_18905 [Pseudomonadota bacterium]